MTRAFFDEEGAKRVDFNYFRSLRTFNFFHNEFEHLRVIQPDVDSWVVRISAFGDASLNTSNLGPCGKLLKEAS